MAPLLAKPKNSVITRPQAVAISAPADAVWHSFFLGDDTATDDFMAERASRQQDAREAL